MLRSLHKVCDLKNICPSSKILSCRKTKGTYINREKAETL